MPNNQFNPLPTYRIVAVGAVCGIVLTLMLMPFFPNTLALFARLLISTDSLTQHSIAFSVKSGLPINLIASWLVLVGGTIGALIGLLVARIKTTHSKQ